MKRKGQVYILAAILIAIVLFGLAAVKNRFEQKELRGDFEAISENFRIESSRLINSAVKAGVDVHNTSRDFNTMFTAYAKGKNPNYGLVYVLDFDYEYCEKLPPEGYGGCIQVGNFWDKPIVVQGCGEGGFYSVTIPGCFEHIPAALKFEGFSIETDLFLAASEFEFRSKDCGTSDSCSCCIFLPSTGAMTDLAISIGGVPYYMCVKKGIPELMVVELAAQEEQTQVSSTGECVGRDFCTSLNTKTDCDSCGQGICCWWENEFLENGGRCLSDNVEINKKKCAGECDPPYADKDCPAQAYQACGIDKNIYWYDAWGDRGELVEPDGDCVSEGEECRTPKEDKPECCIVYDKQECYKDNLYWYSDCKTREGLVEDCDRYCEKDACCKYLGQACFDNKVCNYYDDCGNVKDCDIECGINKECRCVGYVCQCVSLCTPEASVRCGRADYGENPNIVYWVDSCGNTGDVKKDCGLVGCENGQCKTPKPKKQLKCGTNCWAYADHCKDMPAACKAYCPGTEGSYECLGESGDRYGRCYRWSDCSASPSCGGDIYLGEEQSC